MIEAEKTRQQLLAALQEITARMTEAEDTLRAIRNGEVDALVVETTEGDRVFTLSGADHPYRVMIETMNEGAATLASDGMILFCNQRLAEIIHKPLDQVIGSSIYQYISPAEVPVFAALFEQGLRGNSKLEMALQVGGEIPTPVLLSISAFAYTDISGMACLVVTDLREQKRNEAILAEEKLTTQILDQAAEIFVLCDRQGRVTRASRSTQRLFGKSPLFQIFDEAFHLLTPDGSPFALLPAMGDRFLNGVEVLFKQGENRLCSFLLSANALITPAGVVGIEIGRASCRERV